MGREANIVANKELAQVGVLISSTEVISTIG